MAKGLDMIPIARKAMAMELATTTLTAVDMRAAMGRATVKATEEPSTMDMGVVMVAATQSAMEPYLRRVGMTPA